MDISVTILVPPTMNFDHMYIRTIWRERSVIILMEVLVFILCQNTGNILVLFTFHKIKSRTYINKSETPFPPFICQEKYVKI